MASCVALPPSRGSLRTSATTTAAAPSRARAKAVARPIPLAAPVTTATLPSTSPAMSVAPSAQAGDEVPDGGAHLGREGERDAVRPALDGDDAPAVGQEAAHLLGQRHREDPVAGALDAQGRALDLTEAVVDVVP